MFRNRDLFAIVGVVILSRMAWTTRTENIGASASLAFYMPRERASVLTPVDIDGDGIYEALAVVQNPKGATHWVLNLMDLVPLHQKSMIGMPFVPEKTLSSSDLILDDGESDYAVPLKLKGGQILIEHPQVAEKLSKKVKDSKKYEDKEINERTRHYFCGTSWHEAGEKCSAPCPGGQQSECPAGEQCYADTPCDFHALEDNAKKEQTQALYHLTASGGLSGLVTLWSNGAVTMHSLIKEKIEIVKRKPKDGTRFELRELWRTRILPEFVDLHTLEWVEFDILFLDALSSMEASHADHGMVVIGGTFKTSLDERSSFTVALEAMSGKLLWDSFSNAETQKEELPLPLIRGHTSFARRRSRIPALKDELPTTDVEHLPNCMVTLKQHWKQVLPYAYWGARDSAVLAVHLTQKKHRGSHGGKNRHHDDHHHDFNKHHIEAQSPHGYHYKNKHRRHQKTHGSPSYGRPNAIVTHMEGAMQVRSLRNGMPLCHMSLLEEALYTDLNNDGVIDNVQILLENKTDKPKDDWVWKLVSRLQKEKEDAKHAKWKQVSNAGLCHALALSGLPTKEELFSTSICGSETEQVGRHPTINLDAAPPITVESLTGRRDTRDVIVALNNGVVHRIQGTSGRRAWETSGHGEIFPTWEAGKPNVLLTRVPSSRIPAPIQPILLSGENSFAIMSVKDGKVLAQVEFPQTALSYRPILADLSGDGTAELVMMTTDGIWGFQITVWAESSIFFQLAVGFLIFILMLAAVRHKHINKGGKDRRGTDA